MRRRSWTRLVPRLAAVLLEPARDPTAVRQSGSYAAALARIDGVLAAVEEMRPRLDAGLLNASSRLEEISRELEQRSGVGGRDAWLISQQSIIAREVAYMRRALDDLEVEERRLSFLRERLTIQGGSLDLRREVAATRHSAAEARYDASGSLLDLRDGPAGFDASLAAIEKRAAFAEARASALEELAAGRSGQPSLEGDDHRAG